MKIIKLTQGKYALVDDEDFEYLNQFHWSVDGSGYPQRAIKTEKGWRPLRMHRDILKLVGHATSDHKDLNRLNNQRNNLRKCTQAENNRNIRINNKNTSGYKGVGFRKEKWRTKRWDAVIHFNNKKFYLGGYFTKEEAARVYNEAAMKYFGEFARLNTI